MTIRYPQRKLPGKREILIGERSTYMESVAVHITALQNIEKRARARPCSLEDLVSLEREMKQYVEMLRQERETTREKTVIDTETPELRNAVHAARLAIRNAMSEHEEARKDVSRVEEMVRHGHLHEAASERTKAQLSVNFKDLNLDFVSSAVTKQYARERRMVIAGVFLAMILLVVATIVELMKRSTANSP